MDEASDGAALNFGRVMSTSSMLAGSTDDGVVGLDRSFGAVSSARCTISLALADFIVSCFVGGGNPPPPEAAPTVAQSNS